jgi:hypothetical protein
MPKSDDRLCKRHGELLSNSMSSFRAVYSWPPSASSFHVNFSLASSEGSILTLQVHRRIRDSAEAVAFALTGNIQSLKTVFRQKLVTPRDVSVSRGYSLLQARSSCHIFSFSTRLFLTQNSGLCTADNMRHANTLLRRAPILSTGKRAAHMITICLLY